MKYFKCTCGRLYKGRLRDKDLRLACLLREDTTHEFYSKSRKKWIISDCSNTQPNMKKQEISYEEFVMEML